MAAGTSGPKAGAPKQRAKPKAKAAAAAAPVEAVLPSEIAKQKLEVVLAQRSEAQSWALRVSPCELGKEMSSTFSQHAETLTQAYMQLQKLVIARSTDARAYEDIYATLDPVLEPGLRMGSGACRYFPNSDVARAGSSSPSCAKASPASPALPTHPRMSHSRGAAGELPEARVGCG